ncbi:MAG: fibronectin type III domain-containing protein [Cyclobacteriaceae bacterium]|nr:fibronectin type III domain-containing protein [Cyclobacteriaceae bacterium]
MKNLFTILLLTLCFYSLQHDVLVAQSWFWSAPIGGLDADEAHGVAADSEGNSYVTGSYSGTATMGSTVLNSAGETDIYLAKFDNNGNVIWAVSAGGLGADNGKQVSLDADGNVYVAGEISGNANFQGSAIISGGGLDVFLAKYDSDGNFISVINAFSTSLDDEVSGMDNDANGNVYLTGEYDTGVDLSDIFVSKHEDSGLTNQWTEFISGTGTQFDPSMAVDDAGNSFVTGNFDGSTDIGDTTLMASSSVDLLVAKFLTSGELEWVSQILITGFSRIKDVSVDQAGSPYVVGQVDFIADFGSVIINSNADMDAFYAKYNTGGIVQWAGSSDNAEFITGESITVNPDGTSYIGGILEGFNAFGSLNLASIGEDDSYVVKLDSTGTPVWGKNIVEIDNGGFHLITDMAVGLDDEPVVVGYFNGELGFDDTSLFPTSDENDGFLAKLGEALCEDIELVLNTSDITTTEATVFWDGAVADEFLYRYRELPNGTWEPTETTTASSITLTGLDPGTEYVVRVRAFCDGASIAARSITFTTEMGTTTSCNLPPQNLSTSAITTTGATITWDAVDPTSLINHQYRYRTAGTPWITGTTTSNSLVLTGLTPGSHYEFRVRNQCDSGNSPPSSISFSTTAAVSNTQISPNPVVNELLISSSEATVVRIYDLTGALRKEMQLTKDAKMDVSALEPGIYILKAFSSSGINTQRIIKE